MKINKGNLKIILSYISGPLFIIIWCFIILPVITFFGRIFCPEFFDTKNISFMENIFILTMFSIIILGWIAFILLIGWIIKDIFKFITEK